VRSERLARLYASDPQLQTLKPSPAVLDAARRPGLRLAELLRTFMQGYADRPALGTRATSVVRDPLTGRAEQRLLPAFDTITYGEVWSNVTAIAAAWASDGEP